MNLYWKGTNIRVSRLRFWLFNLLLPEKVKQLWNEHEHRLLMDLDEARKDAFFAREEAQHRDSVHERNWLQQASVYSGIDLSDHGSEYRGETFNHALNCAKEAYHRGLRYREFLSFYNRYRGVA